MLSMFAVVPPPASFAEPIVTCVTTRAVTATARATGTTIDRLRDRIACTRGADCLRAMRLTDASKTRRA